VPGPKSPQCARARQPPVCQGTTAPSVPGHNSPQCARAQQPPVCQGTTAPSVPGHNSPQCARAQQPPVCQGLLIIEATRSHSFRLAKEYLLIPPTVTPSGLTHLTNNYTKITSFSFVTLFFSLSHSSNTFSFAYRLYFAYIFEGFQANGQFDAVHITCLGGLPSEISDR
jgi:hypothetical protein